MYSSAEVGLMAAECPDHALDRDGGHYLVAEENLILEVLHPEGSACAPGEVGHVVVTDLHNYATPIIRSDIGDLAEPGPPCPSGRGLMTLKRIVGRVTASQIASASAASFLFRLT